MLLPQRPQSTDRKPPPRNFKKRLCELLNISPKQIGVRSGEALFAYGHDRRFRESTDELHAAIAQRIGEEAIMGKNRAQRLGVCSRLTGSENEQQLMELFLSPQGIEFCQQHNFPELELFRGFRGPEAARNGIFIDAGPLRLENQGRIALIGQTTAELTYSDPAKRHIVVLMHGAKARITASGYAVVFVYNRGGEVVTDARDQAKIL